MGPSPHLGHLNPAKSISPHSSHSSHHSPTERYSGYPSNAKPSYPQQSCKPQNSYPLQPSPHGPSSAPPYMARPKVGSPNLAPTYPKQAGPLTSPSAKSDPGISHSKSAHNQSQGPPPAHGGVKPNQALLTGNWPPHKMVQSHQNPNLTSPRPPSATGSLPPSNGDVLPLPLDLGSTKRKSELNGPLDVHMPQKSARLETLSPPGQLHRVTEPSTLGSSAISAEATPITSVVNTAVVNTEAIISEKPPSISSNENSNLTSASNEQTESSIKVESDPVVDEFKYVHKLKRAWIQCYKPEPDCENTNKGSGSGIGSAGQNSTSNSSNNSNATSPQLTRSTPSPVGSTKSTGSVKGFPSAVKSAAEALKVNGVNGDQEEENDLDDFSSDNEESKPVEKPKPKGKPGPKPKLKPGPKPKQTPRKKTRSESDNNSDSEKDSDSSKTSKKSESSGKKRGRKPGPKKKPTDIEEPKNKKLKPDESKPTEPFVKPSVSQLKKTGDSFLQDASCFEVAPKLNKCRECRGSLAQRQKQSMANIFCRFYAFRRLRYTKNGQLAGAGFSDPVTDASVEDTALWTPNVDDPPADLDVDTSKFLISHVGDQFCDLVQSEKEAMAMQAPEDIVMAWKRVVQGVREMCDVCETTLFNVHWACSKCGFVVCVDCYKGRKNGTSKTVDEPPKDRDEYSWLLCASRVAHEQDKLMLTQIISGNALLNLGKKVHEVRHNWGIPQLCECPEAEKYKKESTDEKKKVNGLNKDLLKTVKKEVKPELVNGVLKTEKENVNGKDEEMSNSPLNFFADVALSNDKRDESSDSDSDSSSDEKGNFSTLRELLIRPNAKSNGNAKDGDGSGTKPTKEGGKKKAKVDSLDDVISCVGATNGDKDEKKSENDMVLKHFVRKYNYVRHGREPLPIRIMTKVESSTLYPKTPHSWLCDGKLLRLLDPLNPNNKEMFQDMWKRGQPIIVSGVGQKLSQDVWKPSAFSKDFGEIKNDLINCLTGNIVPNQPMKKFWDGFDHYGKRLKDDKGQPMVLKLKDWPPTDDFAEILPTRFE